MCHVSCLTTECHFRVRNNIRDNVGDVDVAAVPCGFGNAIGNKVNAAIRSYTNLHLHFIFSYISNSLLSTGSSWFEVENLRASNLFCELSLCCTPGGC